jgi:hypothetical protein
MKLPSILLSAFLLCSRVSAKNGQVNRDLRRHRHGGHGQGGNNKHSGICQDILAEPGTCRSRYDEQGCPDRYICRKGGGTLSGFCLAIAEVGAGEDCVVTEEQCTAALVDCRCSSADPDVIDFSNVGHERRTKLNKLCEQMLLAPYLGDACPTVRRWEPGQRKKFAALILKQKDLKMFSAPRSKHCMTARQLLSNVQMF